MNKYLSIVFIVFSALIFIGCNSENAQTVNEKNVNSTQNIEEKPKIIAENFAYPIGKTEFITDAKDKKDDWYNAQDFTQNNHLGEDWNKNSGGNSDCGELVFAAADGNIVFAENAGIGWGNVIIIEHVLPDGKKVQTLYGHLEKILKKSGEIKKREQIGTVGNADGRYLCHLHFELREESCPMWNQAGAGYSAENSGWLDPSKFIDKHLK